MFKRIVVPIDGSPAAEEALLAAGLLAEREEATLMAAHVEPDSGRARDTAAKTAAERQVAELRWRGVRAEYRIEYGKAEERIALLASAEDADLIVMAPHHRHMVEAMRHPSVTARTFSRATAPVLIWPEGLPGETFRGFLRLPNAAVFVPLDGSPEAERALPFAFAFAQEYGRLLLLVRVLTPAPLASLGMSYSLATQTPSEDERDARQYLSTLRRRLAGETGLTVQTMLLSGDAAAALTRELEAHEGSLVVMATHGRGLVARTLLGSVATSLMCQTPVPLLVVPPAASAAVEGAEARQPVGVAAP